MGDAMDAVQDRVIEDQERMQAQRLARATPLPLPSNIRGVICIECDAPIDPRRVQAMPGCKRCVDCESRSERRNGRY